MTFAFHAIQRGLKKRDEFINKKNCVQSIGGCMVIFFSRVHFETLVHLEFYI